MMKVVHVIEAWKGGIASYVEALVKYQLAKGYTVFLLADSNQLDTDARDLGAEVINYKSSRSPLAFIRIAKEISEKIEIISPDIVHCHSTFPGIYVRLLKNSNKVIYTPHAWSFFKKDVGWLARFTYKRIEYFMSKRCKKIICMSLEEMKAARSIGISPERLSLVYTGIPGLSQGIAATKKNESCSGDGPLKVGFFGRFDYQKGFDLLEKVVPLLANNVEIHLFGGAVRGDNKRIDSHFFLHGWIDHSKIHDCMSSMDVILIPSRWEGFALTPLEAMRAGRSIIISNLSSLPEVVIHGFNGIILPDYSAEQLAMVLNSLDKTECFRMGENGRKIYEQTFRFDDFAEKVSAVYLS
ncbi:glycosyltransferase family 1 protein [Pseudomonas cavernae]|uniref:Glycosyltransferase family 1 protein n=1 Tax=Pseudomonas cavernae TaxID=2320867 RepID=A0A385Z0S8_9PSED|nr:glycosyltransferase [Pseudomonas cavernae]AYC31463.1 glycosyltransferase family 1 protein [Pseudomonas cavernae]